MHSFMLKVAGAAALPFGSRQHVLQCRKRGEAGDQSLFIAPPTIHDSFKDCAKGFRQSNGLFYSPSGGMY